MWPPRELGLLREIEIEIEKDRAASLPGVLMVNAPNECCIFTRQNILPYELRRRGTRRKKTLIERLKHKTCVSLEPLAVGLRF